MAASTEKEFKYSLLELNMWASLRAENATERAPTHGPINQPTPGISEMARSTAKACSNGTTGINTMGSGRTTRDSEKAR